MQLRITLLIALAALVLSSQPVQAQDRPPLWRATAGAFFPVLLPAGTNADVGFTVAIERTITVQMENSAVIGGSFRYTRYSLDDGQKLSLYSPTVEYRRFFGGKPEAPRFEGAFGGVGAGIVFADNTAGLSGHHFAYSLVLGYERRQIVAEARWLGGFEDGETGVALAVGTRW